MKLFQVKIRFDDEIKQIYSEAISALDASVEILRRFPGAAILSIKGF